MADIVTLPRARRETLRTVQAYGTAAGLDVMLLTEADWDVLSPLRLSLIGPAPIGVEDLAVFPNSAEGRTGADMVGAAVIRALEIVERDHAPTGAA